MNSQIDIAFTTGRTGGHIYPVIALVQELGYKDCFVIGPKERECRKILKKYNIPAVSISFSGNLFIKLLKAFLETRNVLRLLKAKILVSSGGALTFPVVLAAYTLGLPILILEQNAIPGKTNRFLQYLAKYVFISFSESERYFSKTKTILSGNPVRKKFPEDEAYKRFVSEHRPKGEIIVLFGGSQGARSINRLFYNNYEYFKESSYILVHITGESFYKNKFEEPTATFIKNKKGETKIMVFAYFDKMDVLYSLANYVICRAGATTMAEIKKFEKKTIFIPYPHATDEHQKYNAISFTGTFGGVVLEEAELSFERIIKSILELNRQPDPKNSETEDAKKIITKKIDELLWKLV